LLYAGGAIILLSWVGFSEGGDHVFVQKMFIDTYDFTSDNWWRDKLRGLIFS
jgi:hypothetical protein